MRKIIKIFLFIYFLIFFHYTFSDFIICDSGNINLSGTNVNQICNGGFENTDISKIESFTGNFINIDSGNWLVNYDLNNISNISDFLPIGFFDNNVSTFSKNVSPNYDLQIGYLDQNFDNLIQVISIENNFPVGYFDNIKNTVVITTKPQFNNLVGYMGKDVKIYSSTGNENILTNQKIENISNFSSKVLEKTTVKDFYLYIFRKYSNIEFIKKGYNISEYDKFINNLVNLFLKNSYNNSLPFLTEIEQNKIELDISNSNFQYFLSKLMIYMDFINISFQKNDKHIFYILNYLIKK